jgi:hypothetical protein
VIFQAHLKRLYSEVINSRIAATSHSQIKKQPSLQQQQQQRSQEDPEAKRNDGNKFEIRFILVVRYVIFVQF